MITIEIAILRGRYHATPWGRHVNEGVPEWPPSPFRLVRALYDAWRRKRPEWPVERVEPILRALAADAPVFELPPARSSHIRVFYRQGGELEADKKLVFDPFVIVTPGAIVRMGWRSLDVPPGVRSDLDELLGMIGYLGRAESMVTMRCTDARVSANCAPVDQGDMHGDAEVVRVAGVARPDEHAKVEVGKRKRKSDDPMLLSWLDALTWGTREVQDKKLNDPPALRWIRYRRPSDALEARARAADSVERRSVDTVLLSMQGKVRPRVEDSVLIAEQVRRFAMGAHRRIVQDPRRESLILAGKVGRDRPAEGHQHAYYLPWDRDEDGRIDHVIVHAMAGLDPEEVAALDRIRWPAQLNRDQPLAVLPVTVGTRDSMFEGSRRFRSATPFVPTRHYRPTRDGEHGNWLAGQLTLELERHRKGALASPPLHLLNDGRTIGRARRWLEYRRSRKGDTPKLGYGFRIELAQATHGPFSIGYGAHFGLGLFVPETDCLDQGSRDPDLLARGAPRRPRRC